MTPSVFAPAGQHIMHRDSKNTPSIEIMKFAIKFEGSRMSLLRNKIVVYFP
jgi:hypothetical protein